MAHRVCCSRSVRIVPLRLAERTLLTYEGVQAVVPDSDAWCSARAEVVCAAHPPVDFESEARMQKLLGGLRAAMSFECPQAQAVTLVGTVDDADLQSDRGRS